MTTIKEYLARLRFKVDEDQFKKFKDNLAIVGTHLAEVGKVAIGTATALGTSTTLIARKMDQMFFASQRIGAGAGNIQALKFAAEQVGVSTDEAQGTLESLASSIRNQPGLAAYLKNLGIDAAQDKTKVLIQLIGRLNQLYAGQDKFFIRSQIAGMFGINEQTLFMFEKNHDALVKYLEQYQKLSEGTDENARESHKFMGELRDLEDRFIRLGETLSSRFMPTGEKLMDTISHFVTDAIEADKVTSGWSSKLIGLAVALGGATSAFAGVTAGIAATTAAMLIGLPVLTIWKHFHMTPEERKKWEESNQDLRKPGTFNPLTQRTNLTRRERLIHGLPQVEFWDGSRWVPEAEYHGVTSSSAKAPTLDDQIKKYANKFQIDPKLFSALIKQESGFKQSAVSPKGAIGLTQLMPDTAKQLGVDPYSVEGNLAGGARYFHDLLERYAGDVPKALAAYNAGAGKVDKFGGIPPYRETQQYVDNIMKSYLGSQYQGTPKVEISQENNIHVTGVDEPKQAAREIDLLQQRNNADLLRNLQGVLVTGTR